MHACMQNFAMGHWCVVTVYCSASTGRFLNTDSEPLNTTRSSRYKKWAENIGRTCLPGTRVTTCQERMHTMMIPPDVAGFWCPRVAQRHAPTSRVGDSATAWTLTHCAQCFLP
ncbi:unnamed protein product [Ectocarpus sp. 4 AP-2014]